MVSGQSSSSEGQAGTGQTTSLSFVPALLANAFFGTGIGLEEGGFRTTGLGDFGTNARITGEGASSIIDPFGLSQFFPNQGGFEGGGGDPFTDITGSGGGGGGVFGQITGGLDATKNAITGAFNSLPFFGGGKSKQEFADTETLGQLKQSPGSLGFGQGGILNPNDLVSRLTDLANPNINPGVGGGLNAILGGQLGQQAGNQALFGEGGVSSTLGEALETGFKPDLQPVIDEASRRFFEDIVPQLGQSNVALQEGVGPFSTDLSGSLLKQGSALASQLGALEVQNQNLAGDRRNQALGLSPSITNTLFNAPVDAGRNLLNLGEQLAQQGTVGGRQASLLQLLAGQIPSGPIQASSSSNQSKSQGGGIG